LILNAECLLFEFLCSHSQFHFPISWKYIFIVAQKAFPLHAQNVKKMVSIENITVEFGRFTLLDRISFVPNKNERVAPVSKNGAGKSTLLKIMAGLQQPTHGTISLPKEVSVGYLPQQMKLIDSRTVKEKASMAYDHLQKMEQKQGELHTEMAVRTDCESEAYHNIIERATDLQVLLQMSGIHNVEAEMAATEKELPTPEGASDAELLQKYPEAKAKPDRVMNNWERLTLEPERFTR
jgi:ABC-type glutathione transport system ATPase component